MSAQIPRINIKAVWISGLFSAVAMTGTFTLLADSADAQTRTLRIPSDICAVLERQPLDPALAQKIRNRADFVQILQMIDENCPTLGSVLLQTASIPETAAAESGAEIPTTGGTTDTGGTGDTGGDGDGGTGGDGGDGGGTSGGGNGNSSNTNGNSGSSNGQGGSNSAGNQGNGNS